MNSNVQATAVPTRSLLIIGAILVCAASMLVFGFWALFSPRSFIEFVNFSPYNEHITHDAGAFQIGIGVGMLLSLIWADGLVVALGTFIVAGGVHTVNHYVDRHIGGHGSDVPLLGLFTLVAVAAPLARIRANRMTARRDA